MAKKRRVPEVLWRLFRDRARTLADTVVSLIPPSTAAECLCKGRRCLGCSGEDAMLFLLRPDDPSDYRKLLNQCFVVVSSSAPPLGVFCPDPRWSQRQIVRRTIEMIMCEQPISSNVLCSSYDKCNHSSPVVELLTCSAWDLLLERVGDSFMFYLLKYASIFLPLPRKNHHQVAGPPISDLCLKFSKHISESEHQHPSLFQLGYQKKRKRVGGVNAVLKRQQVNSSFGCASPSSFVSCIGCSARSYTRPFSRHCRKKCSQMTLFEAVMPRTGEVSAFSKGNPNGELQQCSNQIDPIEELQQSSNQITAKPRKRARQFSWQRHRKRRQLNFQEANFLTPCTRIHTDKGSLSGGLQGGSNTSLSHHHEKVPQQCSCCLRLQAFWKVTKGAQINRQSMFYKLEYSSSVFPRNHVLNSLKPNFFDANFLIRDIFGLSDANTSLQSMSCFHSSGVCLIGSACLYHSLVKMLKLLIRRAKCCQHLRLLDKHCAVPSFNQNANGNDCSRFEGYESKINSSKKGLAGVQVEGNLQVEKSHGYDDYKRTPDAFDNQLQPNKSYCLKSQVVSFIWAVCRSIVPPDMLGTVSNWRILRRNISKFICLRRFEKFSLRQCMHKLKTSRFPFLSNNHSSCYLSNHGLKFARGQSVDMHNECRELNDASYFMKHKVLESWIFWLFSCLVVPLVQANFYVTESEHGKQDIFYYRKSIWEKLTSSAITCLKDRSFHSLDGASVRSIISNRSFGFSKLRLCPKENGVRVLANLKASSRMPSQESLLRDQSCRMHKKARLHPKQVKFDHFKSVNCVLRDLHAVLKGLQMKESEKLGSSVFDYNDVYRKLCPFLIGLKNGSTIIPRVFVVISDVVKAFDSVDQDKLLSIMKNVFLQDEYLLKQSHQVVCTKKSLRVHEKSIFSDGISNGLTKFASSVLFRSLHTVLVDKEWSRNIRKEDLYFNLTEHVKRNVLQFDRKFYLQDVGIPQGSVLSSLLCSFYYGHLERSVIFPFLEKVYEPASEDLCGRHNFHNAAAAQNGGEDDMILSSPKYILLRFIDDFLFISTSEKQAASFFSRLQRGFREYNCYMNKEKFCLNFDIDEMSGLPSNRVYVSEDGISFLRWSGLLINCCTLEVQADYTRYQNNHLSSTLTVCWEGKPGRHLKEKLCNFMRPKCHPIFYDSNINSAAIVRLNIYQAFLLCAMKFHCYVRDLSCICKLLTGSYVDIIEMSFRYMHKLIKKRMRSIYLGSDFHPVLQLEKQEVEWLGLNAYVRVLKRKQSRHKALLSLLRLKLLEHGKLQNVSSQLKYAVDDSHSSLIWKIKY